MHVLVQIIIHVIFRLSTASSALVPIMSLKKKKLATQYFLLKKKGYDVNTIQQIFPIVRYQL